jgi:hypothetical protein
MATRTMTNTLTAGMPATDDKPTTPMYAMSDDLFGDADECAADAAFVKRLSLIVVPMLFVLCLLTLALEQLGAT